MSLKSLGIIKKTVYFDSTIMNINFHLTTTVKCSVTVFYNQDTVFLLRYLLFLWPCSSSNIRQIPRREALEFIWDWASHCHLAAVWRPKGQSSHLSSLIKATRICMTAPCPHLFLLKQWILKGGNAVAENGTWWYVYPRVTFSSNSSPTNGLWLPQVEAQTWPSLVYCQPLSSFIPVASLCVFFQ